MNGSGVVSDGVVQAADYNTGNSTCTDHSETESESLPFTFNNRIASYGENNTSRETQESDEGTVGIINRSSSVPESVLQNFGASPENGTNANGDPGSPPPNNRDSCSATTRRAKQQYELVLHMIEDAKNSGAIILDLSNKDLTELPRELLNLPKLQYLYLAENKLEHLPENFFDCLNELQWLDLRRNYLVSLPHTYIGRHQHLRTLLLQGNNLKSLPLELGLVPTLHGLNIAENPLEFPPLDVIERGTQGILQFLRELLHAKSQGRLIGAVENIQLSDTDSQGSSSEWGNSRPSRNSLEFPSRKPLIRSDSCDSRGTQGSDQSDLVGPVPQSASLQRRQSYNEMKQQQIEKYRQAGALGILEKKSAKAERHRRRNMQVSCYPEPPRPELVEHRYLEEKRLAKLRELKEKQDLILQRRKDVERLRNWREDSRRMQMRKYRDAMGSGGPAKVEVAEKAPYGTSAEEMRIMTNEQRIAQEVKAKHEKMRRVMSPESQVRQEEERMARDRELERRIRLHMSTMADRRRMPKQTPQEEMLAAKKELEMAEQLKREVDMRRKNLEYRFTAFTGELSLPSPPQPGV